MKIKKYEFPNRIYADMYFPKYTQFVNIFCLCFGMILLSAAIFAIMYSLIGFFFFFLCSIIMETTALFGFFCYYNIMLVVESDEVFVYRTLFGNIYKYNFAEIKELRTGLGGTKIILPDKRITIDRSAVISEQFHCRLDSVRSKLGSADLAMLPSSSEKAESLRKNFYNRR